MVQEKDCVVLSLEEYNRLIGENRVLCYKITHLVGVNKDCEALREENSILREQIDRCEDSFVVAKREIIRLQKELEAYKWHSYLYKIKQKIKRIWEEV